MCIDRQQAIIKKMRMVITKCEKVPSDSMPEGECDEINRLLSEVEAHLDRGRSLLKRTKVLVNG
eukprot:10295097-Lingulodinium_polyedra.AAC.1